MQLKQMETSPLSRTNAASAGQPRLWQIIALVVLLGGWGSGGCLVWRGVVQEREAAARAAQNDDDYDPMLSLEDSKKQTRQLEMYMGKMGLLMYKIEETMDAWGEPKPLGITVIILASLGAAAANAYAKALQRHLAAGSGSATA